MIMWTDVIRHNSQSRRPHANIIRTISVVLNINCTYAAKYMINAKK